MGRGKALSPHAPGRARAWFRGARPCGLGFLVLLLTLGCATPSPLPTATPAPPRRPAVHLTVAAVPAAQARLQEWIAGYGQDHPDVQWEIRPYGAGPAQEALAQGKVDLAFLDQEPVPAYRGVLTATLVAYEPLAIMVHAGNPLRDLASPVVRELFSGRLERWSQAGGEDVPVQVYLSPDTCGDVQAFAREAMAGRHLAHQALVRATAGSLLQAVAQDPGGIGLLPASDVSGAVGIVRIEGAAPGDKGYPWHMPLFLAYGPASPASVQEFIHFVGDIY